MIALAFKTARGRRLRLDKVADLAASLFTSEGACAYPLPMPASPACPRCNLAMDRFTRALPEGGEVFADMCDGCGGVWLDGDAVARAYPAFRGLLERGADLRAAARASGGIGRCPRCAGVATEFPFFELWLDTCARCHGLWVDGDELMDLARTRDRQDGLPAPTEVARGYREGAARVARSATSCAACAASIELHGATMTSLGPMCDPCAQSHEEAFAPAEEPMKIPMTSFFASIFGEDDPQGTASFSEVGSLLGAVIEMSARCPSCGCHSHSRCGHRGSGGWGLFPPK